MKWNTVTLLKGWPAETLGRPSSSLVSKPTETAGPTTTERLRADDDLGEENDGPLGKNSQGQLFEDVDQRQPYRGPLALMSPDRRSLLQSVESCKPKSEIGAGYTASLWCPQCRATTICSIRSVEDLSADPAGVRSPVREPRGVSRLPWCEAAFRCPRIYRLLASARSTLAATYTDRSDTWSSEFMCRIRTVVRPIAVLPRMSRSRHTK